MTIEVLSSTVTTVPTAKGSYQVCELAFKNKTYDNKVEGKKIMSFAEKAAFETLKNAQMGQVFTVGRQKDDKGYWKWTEVTQGETTASMTTQFNSSAPTAGKTSPRSTYETPEERAARQVMIVRQSSISSAVALAAANSKTKVSTEDIISMAKDFEAYVMGTDTVPTALTPSSAMADLIGLTDDIPM